MLFFQPIEYLGIKHFPLSSNPTPCGFPSPTQDYVEKRVDFNNLLVQHPSATYSVKSSGGSMVGAGVGTGNLLVVGGARKTVCEDIVIAAIEGEFTVKCLQLHPVVMLKPENSAYTPIMIGGESTLDIFGMVTSIIKSAG